MNLSIFSCGILPLWERFTPSILFCGELDWLGKAWSPNAQEAFWR